MRRFTPSASVHTHLLVAALLWTGIGIFLAVRGGRWLLAVDGYGWLALGVVIGLLKARLVLDKTARKNIDRILHFADKTCIGGVYSWKTWGLVAAMIVGGRLLRGSSLPVTWVGTLYVAVGTALFFASRLAWQQWHRDGDAAH